MTHLTNIHTDRARRWSLAVVLWAFGLATTVLLIGLWGRTVTSDQPTIEDTARAALTTDVVADRITGWVGDAFDVAALSGNPDFDAVFRAIAATPQFDATLDRLVTEVVDAAMAEPGTDPDLDLATALDPIVPVVVDELGARGIDVPRAQIDAAVAAGSAALLDADETAAVTSVGHQARSFLSTVLVAGLAALVLFGALAIALAEEPLPMVRTLATRLAVTSLTFVVILRVGTWAIDPGRGSSPLPRGGAVLLGSNHLVLFLVAGAALAVALTTGVVIHNRRAAMRTALGGNDDENEDTLELLAV